MVFVTGICGDVLLQSDSTDHVRVFPSRCGPGGGDDCQCSKNPGIHIRRKALLNQVVIHFLNTIISKLYTHSIVPEIYALR